MVAKSQQSGASYPFWFGGAAAMWGTVCTHPFDVVKVRLQTNESRANVGAVQTLVNTIRKEGPFAIYNGLSGSLFRQATYSTTRFGVYDILKRKVASEDGTIPVWKSLLTSMVSGCLGGVVGNPGDVLTIRMANDGKLPLELRRNYKHCFDGLYKIGRDEGILGLFRGVGPNTVRAIFMNSSQLASYDQFKQLLLFKLHLQDNVYTHFAASLLAGLVATTACAPVDVIKTRVMNSAKKENAITVLTSILRNEGPKALFKGWLPAYMRLGPHTIITFVTLEKIRQLWDSRREIAMATI
ncbi:mitochondrial carrier [Basidiobolus meristosporus CBS 931.73]|uniref:Mitochondrial carrier n=1 Tax=Basidiobolus meristosporus CBS 931.73 TaxID=1314790 RepID=A0A1Y1Z666_9FUNG|nr:mitochondrial carrier [Basidiobolus meristosporus CBS 931.73]|eukprot:ORY05749.1 mitochondrial carrier [Basidiobolus meristosporus CBS 931.73]